jgi:GDPmannose 4,6-dehydratase
MDKTFKNRRSKRLRNSSEDECHEVSESNELPIDYSLLTGLSVENGEYVKIDQKYFRPTEVNVLEADTTKAETAFGWKPRVKFDDLVRIMIDADLRAIGEKPIGDGDKLLKFWFTNRWWEND